MRGTAGRRRRGDARPAPGLDGGMAGSGRMSPQLPFLIVAALTAGSAIAAMALRNLVHCALCLVVTFAGLAALYLQLNAEFVGFVQILVYVGAVSILIVFAILLTRGTDPAPPAAIATATPWALSIAVAVLVIMAGAILRTQGTPRPVAPPTAADAGTAAIATSATSAPARVVGVSVKSLGERLMGEYVVPLEVMGLLLTAAMIGAVIIALPERSSAGTRGEERR